MNETPANSGYGSLTIISKQIKRTNSNLITNIYQKTEECP